MLLFYAYFERLLLNFMSRENCLDRDFCVMTDSAGPLNEPFAVPLHISLMVWGHVFQRRRVLTGVSIQSRMGADPLMMIEDFDHLASDPDIHLAFDIFAGY